MKCCIFHECCFPRNNIAVETLSNVELFHSCIFSKVVHELFVGTT